MLVEPGVVIKANALSRWTQAAEGLRAAEWGGGLGNGSQG